MLALGVGREGTDHWQEPGNFEGFHGQMGLVIVVVLLPIGSRIPSEPSKRAL